MNDSHEHPPERTVRETPDGPPPSPPSGSPATPASDTTAGGNVNPAHHVRLLPRIWRHGRTGKAAVIGLPIAVVLAVALPLTLGGRSSATSSNGTADTPLQWIAGPACGISDPRDDLSNEKVFFNTELPSSALPIGADPSSGSTDVWAVSSAAGGGVLAYSEVTSPGEDTFLEITCPDNSHVERDISQ